MEAYPEQLPLTVQNRAFPMGDILVSHKTDMIDQWIEDIGSYNFNRLENYVNYTARPTSMDKTATSDNHVAALALCKEWDKHHEDKQKFAVTGFLITRAFLNATRILPQFDIDMTYELDKMRIKNPQGARAFGRAAWAGMEHSHPSAFIHFEKVHAMSKHFFDLSTDRDNEYYLAGMTLPYMLSAMARLEHYTNRANVSGMITGTPEGLEAMEFHRIFTSSGGQEKSPYQKPV